jgi:hypothetical protein
VDGLEGTAEEAGGGRYFVTSLVLLAHEDDCERIARAHLKKAPNMTPLFGESVISTTKHDQWMKLRSTLGMAFLPTTSLASIFDISVDRAKEAVRIMQGACGSNGENAVNASEVRGAIVSKTPKHAIEFRTCLVFPSRSASTAAACSLRRRR